MWKESSDVPYHFDGGLILKMNVSLIGVNGPTHRGKQQPTKKQSFGSVFEITGNENVFIIVETDTQIKDSLFF